MNQSEVVARIEEICKEFDSRVEVVGLAIARLELAKALAESEAAQPRVQPTPPTEPQNFCNPVNGVHASWCTGHNTAGG